MRHDLFAAMLGTAISVSTVISTPAYAQSATTFTYQGHLAESGTPADGLYEFQVRLLDNLSTQIGATETPLATVTDGVFTMDLDFGPAAFDASQRFLEISVRSVMDGGAFTTLSPNHPVTSAPVAQFALAGNEGPTGPPGNDGLNGSPGTQGPQGEQGTQGLQGNPGTDGNDGAPGTDGSQGPQGDQGTPGDSHWTLSGSNTYYNTGNVGIGTNSPSFPFDVRAADATAIYGESVAPFRPSVWGKNSSLTGNGIGVRGESKSINGRGMIGSTSHLSGNTIGVLGTDDSTSGRGVVGAANAFSGDAIGVQGTTRSTSGKGVYGLADSLSGRNYGVYGESAGTSGRGVFGISTATSGFTYGGFFQSFSPDGVAVWGQMQSATGENYGGYFESNSPDGRGVYAQSNSLTGTTYGVIGEVNSTDGRAVYGYASRSFGTNYGGYFTTESNAGIGIYAEVLRDSGTNYAIYGKSNSPDGYAGYFEGGRNYFQGNVGIGIDNPLFSLHVKSTTGDGIYGETTVSGVSAVRGLSSASTGNNVGIYGESYSTGGRGVLGVATSLTGSTQGVYGISNSTSGSGLYGWASSLTGSSIGVYGKSSSSTGYGAYFEGAQNYFQGNVGIGTTSPTDQLHISVPAGKDAFRVQNDGITRIRVNANGGVSLGSNNTTVTAGNTYVAGNLGIGDDTPTSKLTVAGSGFISADLTIGDDLFVNNDIIAASQLTVGGAKAFTFDINCYGSAGKPGGGSWSVFSDRRLKKNIQPMAGSLDTISALRPVNFEYKSEDHFSYLPGVQRGFIAQEVQRVIPQWVNTAKDGYLYLDQTGYEALIVDAIQELRAEKDAEISQLQARINRLERAVSILLDEK